MSDRAPAPFEAGVHPDCLRAWRPQGESMTYADAAWLGAAWGLAGHATLHFFSAVIPELGMLLAPFRPDRFAPTA